MSKKIEFTKEQETKIINFYLMPNSLKATIKYFSLSDIKFVKDILKRNNIPQHSKTVYRTIQVNTTKTNNFKKYGVSNIAKLDTVKEKVKKTCLKKYGVAFAGQAEMAKEKSKETCLKKYGVEYSFQSENNKCKTKETNLKNLGVEHPMQNQEVKEKVKNTFLKNYGVENPAQSLEIHKKATKKYLFNKLKFDSLPELAIWIYCIDHNIKIEREPIKLEYLINNKKYYYIPDFKINDKLIEIKGDHFFNANGELYNPFNNSEFEQLKNKEKYKCMLTHNVTILKNNDYKFALDYLKQINFNYKACNIF